MNHSRVYRLLPVALFAALMLLPSASSQGQPASAEEQQAGKAEEAGTPAGTQPEKPATDAKAAAPEPEWVTGKIYKVDAEEKVVGILVQQGRAYRKYKLFLDDKSLILVNEQPSSLEALKDGMFVEAGYVKKGKQEVVDTIKAKAEGE